jgi:hypothetical protein
LGCRTSFVGLRRHGRGDCKVRLTDGSVSFLAFSLARIGGVPLCWEGFALFEPRGFLGTGVGRVASRPVILTCVLMLNGTEISVLDPSWCCMILVSCSGIASPPHLTEDKLMARLSSTYLFLCCHDFNMTRAQQRYVVVVLVLLAIRPANVLLMAIYLALLDSFEPGSSFWKGRTWGPFVIPSLHTAPAKRSKTPTPRLTRRRFPEEFCEYGVRMPQRCHGMALVLFVRRRPGLEKAPGKNHSFRNTAVACSAAILKSFI